MGDGVMDKVNHESTCFVTVISTLTEMFFQGPISSETSLTKITTA